MLNTISFDSIFSSTEIAETLTLEGTLIIILSSLFIGLFISIIYMLTNKDKYSSSFVITLIMLPAIIATIILLIGSNVARAFSLAGAFSLIRFRSTPGDAKDISYAFFSLGVGLACGMGYIAYAILFAVVLCSTMLILHLTKFGKKNSMPLELRIKVPEDLNYEGSFDTTLKKYTTNYKLAKVKTSEFGSLFELFYSINPKDGYNSKEFIDELRTLNGNLNITLALQSQEDIF